LTRPDRIGYLFEILAGAYRFIPTTEAPNPGCNTARRGDGNSP